MYTQSLLPAMPSPSSTPQLRGNFLMEVLPNTPIEDFCPKPHCRDLPSWSPLHQAWEICPQPCESTAPSPGPGMGICSGNTGKVAVCMDEAGLGHHFPSWHFPGTDTYRDMGHMRDWNVIGFRMPQKRIFRGSFVDYLCFNLMVSQN